MVHHILATIELCQFSLLICAATIVIITVLLFYVIIVYTLISLLKKFSSRAKMTNVKIFYYSNNIYSEYMVHV